MPNIGLLIIEYEYTCAQDSICIAKAIKHHIFSNNLSGHRDHWVDLPLHYLDSLNYLVIYVFDAEWRFALIRNLTFDLGVNNKIKKVLAVGIPHIDWKNKRGLDLTQPFENGV